tara:strand:+ start:1400 stop:1861 length:462 start_codon:yes stop_codon:yes gene_type:complete
MTQIETRDTQIPAMSARSVETVSRLEEMALAQPQIPIKTHHTIHSGVYSRTMFAPAGCLITGALIKINTTVIISGDVTFYVGDGAVDFSGYSVIPAYAGRKQAVLVHTDSYITMLFQTTATSVEEAEKEFTDEYELLGSHKVEELNTTLVTGV